MLEIEKKLRSVWDNKQRYVDEFYDNYVWVKENNELDLIMDKYILFKKRSHYIVKLTEEGICSKDVYERMFFDWMRWDIKSLRGVRGKKIKKYVRNSSFEDGNDEYIEEKWKIPFVLGEGVIYVNEEVGEWSEKGLVEFGLMMRLNKYILDNFDISNLTHRNLARLVYSYGVLGKKFKGEDFVGDMSVALGIRKKNRTDRMCLSSIKAFDLLEYKTLMMYIMEDAYVNSYSLYEDTCYLSIESEEINEREKIKNIFRRDKWVANKVDFYYGKLILVKDELDNGSEFRELEPDANRGKVEEYREFEFEDIVYLCVGEEVKKRNKGRK